MKKCSSYTVRVGATHKYSVHLHPEAFWRADLGSQASCSECLAYRTGPLVLGINAWKQVLANQTHWNRTTLIDSFQKSHYSVFLNST